MIKGWKRLNKRQRKHLSEHGILQSTFLAQRTFDEQRRQEFKSGLMPCWDCYFISVRLGMCKDQKQLEAEEGEQ